MTGSPFPPAPARLREVALLGALLAGVAPPPLAAQCPDGTPPPCSAPRVTRAAAPAANSVAVLYFDNLSRDSADAYLADGLTEEVIARLGQVGRLSVKSRGMVQRYRDRALDPTALGRALGVANLVSGSVRRAGNQIRVTVEMVRAANGVQVWSDVFTRGDGDVFAIQEEIARAVATQVAGRLAPGERATITARPTRSREAYDHYLRGNFYLAQRTSEAVHRAIDEYETAARLDPGFVAARARVGAAYGVFLSWAWPHPTLPNESLFARGLAAAAAALRSDSASADAWLATAMLEQLRANRFGAAEQAAARAIALDPSNAEAYHAQGWILLQLARDSAAEAAYRRALALEPGRAATYSHLSRIASAHRRQEHAEALLDTALTLDPGFFIGYARRAMVRLNRGNVAGARRDAVVAAGLERSPRMEALLARVELAEGDSAGARARLAPLTAPGVSFSWIFTGPALIAAGDTALVLDLLERATAAGGSVGASPWLRGVEYDPIRNNPRFQRVVAMGRQRR